MLAPMLVLHLGNKNYSSWSLRPWVLLRELGMPFSERMHPFAQGEDFSSFSPSGKVPCLHHHDLAVWDSLAIIEYVADLNRGAWPSDRAARAWARSASAEMHSSFAALRSVCSMNCGVRVALRSIDPVLARDLARLDALWTEGLKRFGGPWLAGRRFTAVDAMFAPVAFRVQTYGLELSPRAREWVDRALATTSMRTWYEDALREPWRDADHEADIDRVGVITQDLRLDSVRAVG